MDRRKFIRLAGSGATFAIASGILPGLAGLLVADPLIPHLELVGKKRPPLFGHDFNLRKKAAEAFADMRADMAGAGIDLYALSSYRSFEHQRRIWNRKYAKYEEWRLDKNAIIERVIRYSSIPGTSRHHWGTEIDVIDNAPTAPENPLHPDHFREGGCYEKLGAWLKEKAGSYGYCQAYTDDPDRTGFGYEPWHISYTELSVGLLEEYMEIPLRRFLIDDSIRGSEQFSREFVESYRKEFLLGINPILLPHDYRQQASSDAVDSI